ncbi:MAG: response regulator [Candidatus Scalinduaceae bacterium]
MSITRILIVADARDTVDELRDFFELNGYETEVALSIKVASTILEERRMDLAIIGFMVKDTPGIEILKKLKTINPFIPVILIHGNNSKRLKALTMKAGAQGYIPKPIDRNSFLRTVKKILTYHSNKVGKNYL